MTTAVDFSELCLEMCRRHAPVFTRQGLLLTESIQAGIAFSVADRPAVMETFGELAYLLCLPLYRYRTTRMLDEDSRDWTRVEIIRQSDKPVAYICDTNNVNEQWWVDGEPPEPLIDDNNLFVGLLLRLSQLRASGFVADGTEERREFGLDRPEITAIVYVSNSPDRPDGEKQELFKLSIGSRSAYEPGMRYAGLNDAGPIFLLPENLVESLTTVYR